jgi:hypothetical protein
MNITNEYFLFGKKIIKLLFPYDLMLIYKLKFTINYKTC